MKSALIIVSAIMIFTSCDFNNGQKSISQDSVPTNCQVNHERSELCFQRLDGSSSQDTSLIRLIINKETVTGDFNYIPYQKDSRRGTLTGVKNGNIIKGVWTFMQEGITDTISVEFKLQNDKLFQKTFGVDRVTGRQKLTDTSTFSIPYTKVLCD